MELHTNSVIYQLPRFTTIHSQAAVDRKGILLPLTADQALGQVAFGVAQEAVTPVQAAAAASGRTNPSPNTSFLWPRSR